MALWIGEHGGEADALNTRIFFDAGQVEHRGRHVDGTDQTVGHCRLVAPFG